MKKLRKLLFIFLWLLIWQAAALAVDNAFLLSGPLEVAAQLGRDVVTGQFWYIVFHSVLRICLGFISAFVMGGLLGTLAWRWKWMEEFLAPAMSVMKSIPVASFVVLLLIWFGSGNLAIWIAFLIVLPNLYFQTLTGLGNTDEKLREVALVYRIPLWNRIWYLYRPALAPFLLSGCRVSVGMAWKAGVAAEVIGISRYSIGERIYFSKTTLSNVQLLSWTLVCLLLSFLMERLFVWLLGIALKTKIPVAAGKSSQAVLQGNKKTPKNIWKRSKKIPKNIWKGNAELSVENLMTVEKVAGVSEHELTNVVRITGLSKRYNEHQVLDRFDLELGTGGVYALMAPSGAGKTTLLRILAGLEQAEAGRIDGLPPERSMVFQENRLFLDFDLVWNLKIAGCIGETAWRSLMAEIVPENSLNQPLREYSGGMLRRAEIARCMLSGGEFLILDEPFNGLDETTKAQVADWIGRLRHGRTILMTTHKREEALLLGAEIVEL